MKYSFILLLIYFLGCSKVEPRRPINPKPSTSIMEETLEENKRVNELEEQYINAYIKNDSIREYIQSSHGFWYTYLEKVDIDKPMPKTGDEVELSYNISSLNDEVLYTKEELGIKNYKVDKEDFLRGLQEGVKLMKVGETITFILPYYNAFGVSGDYERIGINQSIKSTVTLINIINNENENN